MPEYGSEYWEYDEPKVDPEVEKQYADKLDALIRELRESEEEPCAWRPAPTAEQVAAGLVKKQDPVIAYINKEGTT